VPVPVPVPVPWLRRRNGLWYSPQRVQKFTFEKFSYTIYVSKNHWLEHQTVTLFATTHKASAFRFSYI
jgi:hypothetical protein